MREMIEGSLPRPHSVNAYNISPYFPVVELTYNRISSGPSLEYTLKSLGSVDLFHLEFNIPLCAADV